MKSLPLAVAVLLLFAAPASADPLAAPEDLTAQRVAEGVLLTWTGLPDAYGYIVYRNGAAIGNTSGESFTDATAPSASAMTVYWVTALLPSGESPPSNPTSPPEGPCAGPSLDFPYFFVNPDYCEQWVWWIISQVGSSP